MEVMYYIIQNNGHRKDRSFVFTVLQTQNLTVKLSPGVTDRSQDRINTGFIFKVCILLNFADRRDLICELIFDPETINIVPTTIKGVAAAIINKPENAFKRSTYTLSESLMEEMPPKKIRPPITSSPAPIAIVPLALLWE